MATWGSQMGIPSRSGANGGVSSDTGSARSSVTENLINDGAGPSRSNGAGSSRAPPQRNRKETSINMEAGSSRDNLARKKRRSMVASRGGTCGYGKRKKMIRNFDTQRAGYEERMRKHSTSSESDADFAEKVALRKAKIELPPTVSESKKTWVRLDKNMCKQSLAVDENKPLRGVRLPNDFGVKIVDEKDEELHRNPSYPRLDDDDVLKNVKRFQDGSGLLRGPRRVLRLCLFALVLPLVLVVVPLYVRLIIYRPQVYAMAPSDQRLVDGMVSSVWCQGQGVHMNGSFNAYLVPHAPPTSRIRPRYTIIKNLSMRDDVKEYWGFYLKEGSTVTLSTCTRYDGGQLLILRGSENLRKCAWIGEEDSLEEINDHPPTEEDLKHLRVATDANSDEYEDAMTNRRIGSRTFKADRENINVETIATDNDELPTSFKTSEERQGHVSLLLSKALKMSKGKNELMDLLHAHQDTLTDAESEIGVGDAENIEQITASTEIENDLIGERKVPLVDDNTLRSRTARALQQEDRDGAFEVSDEEAAEEDIPVKKYTRHEIGAEQIIGGLTIPDGLTYERGFVNQSHNNDLSREEHKSSYSSSEEALAKCEGVILALALRPDNKCSNFNHIQSNKISYDITVDGTYYFVFSSDNEIVVNDLYFNMTLDKVVYDTSENVANCTGSNNCSLSFGFWSDDKTVVEVPADGSFDNSFVLSTTCEPRVAVYLGFLLLVPVMILFCSVR